MCVCFHTSITMGITCPHKHIEIKKHILPFLTTIRGWYRVIGMYVVSEGLACVGVYMFFSVPNPVHKLFSQTVSLGGELLASTGDEWRAHRASIPAVLPVGLGTSCSSHHRPGHRLTRRLRMDHTHCIRTGARGCVSAYKYVFKKVCVC